MNVCLPYGAFRLTWCGSGIGMLYIGAGDIFLRELAQHKNSLAGKILRVTPDGEIPTDNPDPGSAIWSLSPRNVKGLAWHP